MKLLAIFGFTITLFSALLNITQAATKPISLPQNQDPLTRNDARMNGEKFLQAWLDKNNEQERLKANMYLLGIMDATEGKAWCSYQIALPNSLRESVYSYFKKLPEQRKQESAAVLITEALAQDLPCQNGEKL